MIKVDGLSKSYDGVKVLHNLSFTINENEIFGLLGPNGAGKTTTLECIEGIKRYEEGSIFIKDFSPDEALKKGVIGVQLQNSSLPENINVHDLLKLYCHWKKQPFDQTFFDAHGLTPLFQKLYKNLSTGQKRKLHLTLALISNPDIVFLDEPTAGLDVDSRHQLHQQILELKKQGKTIVISSHDMAEVQHLCDRVAILVKGEIHAIDSPNVILSEDTYTNTMKVKLSQESSSFELKNATYIKTSGGYHSFQIHHLHNALSNLLAWADENAAVIEDIIIDKPSLEERFIELTKEAK